VVTPIRLTPTGRLRLVRAIERATDQNRPIELEPGIFPTEPGRTNVIPISRNGLRIRPAPRARSAPRSIICRPDHSIDLAHPDDNHGLFFVPEDPSEDERHPTTWRHYQRGTEEFEFTIILRGVISITGVDIDCNMGAQGLEHLERGQSAEHSSMLGFRGIKVQVDDGPDDMKRFVFVGFESVELVDVRLANGGWASDIWFSRGYFNPHIARVRIDRLRAGKRHNRKRADVDFSGLCQDISISDSTFFRLGCEATDAPFREMPRLSADFRPSTWKLSDLRLGGIDLGAHGRSYVIQGERLTTTEQCTIHEAGGRITDSDLTVTNRQRLIALDDFVFRDVRWKLKTEGDNLGLKIAPRPGEPSEVSFLDNTFLVTGVATDQVVLDSDFVPQTDPIPDAEKREVRVVALGCTYPPSFGHAGEPPIARVLARGDWTFAKADLGDRVPDVALPRNPEHDDIVTLNVV
jgi:hypothetical protein